MDLSSEEQSRTVVSSRTINAPVGDVFDAYANPQKINGYFPYICCWAFESHPNSMI
jgi:uncharacterized protein YndB with AHSA1/START domain